MHVPMGVNCPTLNYSVGEYFKLDQYRLGYWGSICHMC